MTARSDLFALGLVLYEVFTGRRAFPATTPTELRQLYAEGTPSKPSGHVSGLDPAVERAILRCLERDPADRPRSAYEVLASLPGGDPLAAALAAGETPSPRMVADAGGEGTIRPWVGLALLGVVVASIVLVALLADRVMLFRKVPLPEPPEVLARRARQVLEHCGYVDPPADTAYHFRVDAEVLLHIMREDPVAGPLGRPGDFPTRAPLLLLPAKPPVARPDGRHQGRRHREPPRHGRQPAADPAGDGRRPPGPERLAAPAVRHPASAVRCAAHPGGPGLGPLVRLPDGRLRAERSSAGPTGMGAAVCLRSAGGLDRGAARLPGPPGARRGGDLPGPPGLFRGGARRAGSRTAAPTLRGRDPHRGGRPPGRGRAAGDPEPAPGPRGRAWGRAPGLGDPGGPGRGMAHRRPPHPLRGDDAARRVPRRRGVARPRLRAGLPGRRAGRPTAVAVADHRLEPAARWPPPRPDGGARRADRPALRGRGAARPAGGDGCPRRGSASRRRRP